MGLFHISLAVEADDREKAWEKADDLIGRIVGSGESLADYGEIEDADPDYQPST